MNFFSSVLLLVFSTVFVISPAVGLTEDSASRSDIAVSEDSSVELQSPRRTVRTFLEGMRAVCEGQNSVYKSALSTLDLSPIPLSVRPEEGKKIAVNILSVMNRF
ncbi:MAG: hypothetical protein R3A13_03155 [Bdellovibrionota bacterium]